MIIGIDPGPEQSAFVVWDGISVQRKGILANESFLHYLRDGVLEHGLPKGNHLVVEQIRCYGMAVGEDVLDTVFWSGRFIEAWSPRPWTMMPRMDVKMHLCHDSRAKGTNLLRAVKDRYGKPGTVREPNLTYGEEVGNKDSKMKSHLWAALYLAITFFDQCQVDTAT